MEHSVDRSVELSSILKNVGEFAKIKLTVEEFEPGKTHIPVSGKLLDSADIQLVVEAVLDMWFTGGRFTAEFENTLSKVLNRRRALFVNSGSSANLLALTSLTSPLLGKKRLMPGDEIITAALGFPTTLNPIIQNGMKPVFVDIDATTLNIDVTQIERSITSKTKGIFLAHTLGNPFDLDKVQKICEKYDLFLIEDNCDAFGSTYNGKPTGSFGDIATLSFYPAHHITTGEGGAVLANSPRILKALESFRDWGRDCYCASGEDDTCKKRFDWELGDLPKGYDHKYIYSHVGYNLKASDLQAALGVSQLGKLDEFVKSRKNNFAYLHEELSKVPFLLLAKSTANSEPAWFGFPITISPNEHFSRNEIVKYLNSLNIGTRLMFGGNLSRQPAYSNFLKYEAGQFPNADFVTENSFWIGVQPSLTSEMLKYVCSSIRDFVSSSVRNERTN